MLVNLFLGYIAFIGAGTILSYHSTSAFRETLIKKLDEAKIDYEDPSLFSYFKALIFRPFSCVFSILLSPLLMYANIFDKELVEYLCTKLEITKDNFGHGTMTLKLPNLEIIKEEIAEFKQRKRE